MQRGSRQKQQLLLSQGLSKRLGLLWTSTFLLVMASGVNSFCPLKTPEDQQNDVTAWNKKQRNAESARSSRLRKKQKQIDLSMKHEELKMENEQLASVVKKLKVMSRYLQTGAYAARMCANIYHQPQHPLHCPPDVRGFPAAVPSQPPPAPSSGTFYPKMLGSDGRLGRQAVGGVLMVPPLSAVFDGGDCDRCCQVSTLTGVDVEAFFQELGE